MSAATPGPWRAVGATVQAGSVADSNHATVADCSTDIDLLEMESNARLIATAPTMLDLIRRLSLRVFTVGEADSDLSVEARAIISAVDGQ